MNEKELLRFDFSKKYVFFDYETENLNLRKGNRPWQLAYLIAKGKKILDFRDAYLYWPNINVSPAAAKITGFKKSTYKARCEDPKRVLREFDEIIRDPEYVICGHNILNFDVYLYNIHRKECGLPSNYDFLDRCIDTNCLAKAIKLDVKYNQEEYDFISWQYRFTQHRKRGLKTNLQQLCKDYNIDFDPKKLHEALYDVERNFEVFQKQLWDLEI